MEVRLDRRFELPVPPRDAWALLSDIPAATACMPGATLGAQDGERAWLGGMYARIGPATMNFKGRVELQEIDDAQRRLRMTGRGGDTGSSAVLDLDARVEDGAAPGTCVLVSSARVAVSGRLAQFGSRLLLPVADSMLGSFIANFGREAAARAGAASAGSPPSQHEPVEPQPLSVFALLGAALRRWWLSRRAPLS